jgi:hypothetical protein
MWVPYISPTDLIVIFKSRRMRGRCIAHVNHHLSQKLKLIGRDKFNHLINTLTLHLTCGFRLPFDR